MLAASEVIPDLLREEADEEHTGEAFYNDLFHVRLGPRQGTVLDSPG